jgi:hypothetical protein
MLHAAPIWKLQWPLHTFEKGKGQRNEPVESALSTIHPHDCDLDDEGEQVSYTLDMPQTRLHWV